MCVNDSSNKKSSDPRRDTVCHSVSCKEVLTGEISNKENPVQVKDNICSVNSSINRDPIEQTKHGRAEQLASSARDSPSNSCKPTGKALNRTTQNRKRSRTHKVEAERATDTRPQILLVMIMVMMIMMIMILQNV